MRNRAPPRSAGLLNGHYDKHGRKPARCNGRTLVWLAGVALVATWLVMVYKHGERSVLKSLSSTDDIDATRPAAGRGTAVSTDSIGGGVEHKREKSEHKKKRRGSRTPVCTDSPLKDQEVYPIYGCEEMQVR